MSFLENIPFFSIILSMFSGTISSVLPGKAAKWVNNAVITIIGIMSAILLGYTIHTGESFVFWMGHFPAPWGNEIRAGILEAAMALFFCIIMLLSNIGGRHKLAEELEESKLNLFYILMDLLLSSLLALVYTNDLFTAYVFIEINTIAACGLIMIRQIGRTIEAAVRYMIMSLIGSGLVLFSLCVIYDITGHLLMSNIQEAITQLYHEGAYTVPLQSAIALLCVGLAIKSALFPFHSWLPDAYGYSTVSSAAILSSLVSKGYIFLLIKIFYRVVGMEVMIHSGVFNVLFVFGLLGMVFGSLSAIRENDIRRMIAYSSVAQIGYIYMGFGLGTEMGIIASVFHILAHAATKSMLFISAIGLTDASDYSRKFIKLTGSGYRNVIAGIGFTVGSLSMVGVPMFSGFVSKMLFAQAAVSNHRLKMMPALLVLALSTILNAIYFIKTVIRIYSPAEEPVGRHISLKDQKWYAVSIVLFIALNIYLGMNSEPIVELIRRGLEMFS